MYNSRILVNNIKSLAKERGVLIRDMLDACGLSVNALSQISDKKGISSFSLARIADYLDCSVDYLLGRSAGSPGAGGSSDPSDCQGQSEKNSYNVVIQDFSTAPEDAKNAPSEMDEALLEKYHQLNGDGQARVIDYADTLVQSGKYLKHKTTTTAG